MTGLTLPSKLAPARHFTHSPTYPTLLESTNTTNHQVPHGLWSVTREQIWTFLKDNNFNVVRIPFSAYLALHVRRPSLASLILTDLFRGMDRIGAAGSSP